jgi:hypothetical protein
MNLIDDIPQVSHQKNVVLTAPYLEDEVKKAVFQMEHNKTPDPNAGPVHTYSGPRGRDTKRTLIDNFFWNALYFKSNARTNYLF